VVAAFAQLFSLMVGAFVVPLAAILLIVADTWAGRLFAVAVFCAAGTIALALFGGVPNRRREASPRSGARLRWYRLGGGDRVAGAAGSDGFIGTREPSYSGRWR
jgi:hypothetical protein